MSLARALSRHARRSVRSATIAVAMAATVVLPATAASATDHLDREPADASAPQLPWTSVSEVLAETLQVQAAASAVPATAGAAAAPAAPAVAPEAPAQHRIFATVDGVELHEPSTGIDVLGFHEGSTQGLSLHPVGRVVGNDSAMTAPADVEGPDYRIMPSRGRGVGASTAVDIAMAEDLDVHAVVTGTVVAVADYSLYGRTSDVLIEIVPAGRDDLKVQVFHVRDPQVAPGDVVTAGETVLARPRLLPFGSQIDRFVGAAGPHVHVQVVRA